MNINIKNITKHTFISIVKKHSTMAQAATAMNIPFSTFKRRAIQFNCYKTNQGNKGSHKPKIALIDALGNKTTIKPSHLKHKLWYTGKKKKKCEQCGITDIWNKKPITLELHHKNGNSKDNKLSNLEILCPNCHSQTSNYRNRKHRALKK